MVISAAAEPLAVCTWTRPRPSQRSTMLEARWMSWMRA
jgi:hypothetical protein